MLAVSVLALWRATSRPCHAEVLPAGRPTAVAPGPVRLQTLNLFGLPWPLAPDVAARCRRIARQIDDDAVDIVVLQESWGEDASAPFALPTYHRACCREPACLLGSSGLLTLSRYPIRTAETRFFTTEQGIENLVSKGVLRTVIALPTVELDVFNLHLQSGLDDIAVRVAQIEELLHWLAASDTRHHAIVAGDFNCAPGEPEFDRLLQGMLALDFEHHGCGRPTYDAGANPLAANEQPREIDHIFVRGCEAPTTATRVYDRPIDGLLPSDHFGVEIVAAAVARAPAGVSHRTHGSSPFR